MKIKIIFLLCICLYARTGAQVPSPSVFLGYELGSHFTTHYQLVNYFQAVAKAAPATIKLQQYGQTNGGRPLYLAYISSAENIANLETIRQNNLRIAGLSQEAATRMGKETTTDPAGAKAIVWLSYNVHGNEASSSEASMATLYELATSATTNAKEWLKNTVVIMDPCVNPDGRDRYVNWYNNVVGATPNPDPQSREQREPSPNGRTNKYNFDLNRDWAWQTQIESKQRIQIYNQWMPQIHCDYHEQGYNEPYYFAPAAEPFHEVITPWQRDFQNVIGRNHARYFDANGWLYFTKERFDLLYPSYGDTWPLYNGAIGMTYEQGGGCGLAIINEDGDTLTLKDRLTHHYTTGISTLEVASQNAGRLVENFRKFFENARTNGIGEYKTFVIKGRANEANTKLLLELLQNNGIAYGAANPGTVTGFNYFTGKTQSFQIEQGDFLVSTLQSRGTMAKVLLEPNTKLNDSATYDITAWSLPYAYGIQAYAVREKLTPVTVTAPPAPAPSLPAGAYGFILPWQSMEDARFLTALFQKGIKVRQTAKATDISGKKYPAGSLIIIKTSNKNIPDFESVVLGLARQFNRRLEAVSTGFTDTGADFGSPDVKTLKNLRVACVTGDGVNRQAAGEVWFYFEKELNYPVTMISLQPRMDLRAIDVLILPDGDYGQLFSKDGMLKNWVQQGGRVVAMEGAASDLAQADWGLKNKKEAEPAKDSNAYADVIRYANAERESLKESNPGSIYKMQLDNSHPLAYGYPDFYYTLKQDRNVYEFMKDGWNVGIIKKDGQVAGFTGIKARQKLQDGSLMGQLPVGRGSIVFLAEDPLFRNFWQNGKLLFANAVFIVK